MPMPPLFLHHLLTIPPLLWCAVKVHEWVGCLGVEVGLALVLDRRPATKRAGRLGGCPLSRRWLGRQFRGGRGGGEMQEREGMDDEKYAYNNTGTMTNSTRTSSLKYVNVRVYVHIGQDKRMGGGGRVDGGWMEV